MPARKHPTSPMTGAAARLVAVCLEGAARWPVPKYWVYYSHLAAELLAAKRNPTAVNAAVWQYESLRIHRPIGLNSQSVEAKVGCRVLALQTTRSATLYYPATAATLATYCSS